MSEGKKGRQTVVSHAAQELNAPDPPPRNPDRMAYPASASQKGGRNVTTGVASGLWEAPRRVPPRRGPLLLVTAPGEWIGTSGLPRTSRILRRATDGYTAGSFRSRGRFCPSRGKSSTGLSAHFLSARVWSRLLTPFSSCYPRCRVLRVYIEVRPRSHHGTLRQLDEMKPCTQCFAASATFSVGPVGFPALSWPRRGRFSASPATGLIGLPENGFLGDFFDALGFLSLASER